MTGRYSGGSRWGTAWIIVASLVTAAAIVVPALAGNVGGGEGVDAALTGRLQQLGYTGRVGSTLPERLGRRLDPGLVDTGRNLWFDPITSLNNDNACAGCHSPT